MKQVQRSSFIQKAFPLRYWLFIVYAIGVPTFVRFDVTGITHKQGIFNAWSITTMILSLGTAFVFVILTMLSPAPIFARKVHCGKWVWLSLLLLFLLSTLLEPNFTVRPKPATDVYLSLYRMGEWALGFLLFLSLYTREPVESAALAVASMIGKICWGWLLIVWCVLPIAPSFVYSLSSDGTSSGASHARLGGSLIPPGSLALLAGVSCFHALTSLRGAKRVLAFLFGGTSLAMTYVRGEEIAFLLALILYALCFAKAVPRLLGILGASLSVFAAAAYWSKIMDYLERGNGTYNLETLSDRTQVWTAAFEAFWQRPYIGYGFIAGVKGAIRDHWKFAYWVPPHAHNEFIQALLSGGILAGFLVLLIYFRAFIAALHVVSEGPVYVLFFFTLFQLTVAALLGPLLTGQLGSLGLIFVIAFVAVVDHDRRMHEISRMKPIPLVSMRALSQRRMSRMMDDPQALRPQA